MTNKLASLTASQTEPADRQAIINQDSQATHQQTYPENDQYEHSEEQDPYILDLQDKEGYDSDDKSVRNQTVTHTVSHTVSQPPPEPERITRPNSPGSSSQGSDFDSDNLFLRLKRQRENLLNEVALARDFTRKNPYDR
jgi:hypothetical protein